MVSPVSGISLVTPPTTMNSWIAIVDASPAASSLPKLSRTAIAVRRPRMIRIVYSIRTAARPTSPSSSPTAAMMKSVDAAGTVPG